MNSMVLFNFVDLVNLVILVILVILDFPVIWLNLVDLVSSHFWDSSILLDGIETCFKNNLEPEKIPESKSCDYLVLHLTGTHSNTKLRDVKSKQLYKILYRSGF